MSYLSLLKKISSALSSADRVTSCGIGGLSRTKRDMPRVYTRHICSQTYLYVYVDAEYIRDFEFLSLGEHPVLPCATARRKRYCESYLIWRPNLCPGQREISIRLINKIRKEFLRIEKNTDGRLKFVRTLIAI